jgi:hypothetical protein
MKSFSMHQLLEPKFAEARIKEIAAVFGDYEVSLSIYNKEAGFKDEFYMPEKTEPSHTAPEPELLIPEPIFEKLPLPGPDIEDFAKYFAAAEQALREGNFEFARRSLSQAQSANPGEKNKTDELAARISAEERRKREEDARRKQEEERRKQDEEERRKREEKEEEEEKKKKEIRRDVIICIIVDAIAGAITSLIAGDTFNYFTDGNIAVNFAIIGSIFGAIIGNSFARIRYIIKDHIAFSISQIIWIGITSTTAGISGGIMGFHGHGAFGIILGIIFGIILGAILGIIIAFYK